MISSWAREKQTIAQLQKIKYLVLFLVVLIEKKSQIEYVFVNDFY